MVRKRTVAIVVGAAAATAGILTVPWAALADQIIADDLIVQGSGCFGFDCIDGEAFNFDTVRLRENNLRINFDDTSAAGGFPSNDWRIVINDSLDGGSSFFGIDDATSAKRPLMVEAGARTNSLVVESDGDVGLGTADPAVALHVVKGNTPATRLEQDGSGGFGQQIWDLAGNEANFFVRDVTGGSTLPFRIKPGAPTNALTVSATGNVGMGVDNAQFPLTISDELPRIMIVDSDSGGSGFRIGVTNNDQFFVQDVATAKVYLRIEKDGTFVLAGVGPAPATPNNGDMYVDNASDKTLCFYTKGVWVPIAGNGVLGGGTCS